MPCGRLFPSYFFPSTPLPGRRRPALEPMRGVGKPAIGASIIAAKERLLHGMGRGKEGQRERGQSVLSDVPRTDAQTHRLPAYSPHPHGAGGCATGLVRSNSKW